MRLKSLSNHANQVKSRFENYTSALAVATLHVVTESEKVPERKNLRIKIKELLNKENIEHVTIEIRLPNDEYGFEDC